VDSQNSSADEPREHVPPYYLDLYKLGAEMADRVSARRATANSFFLTLHTGLAAFLTALGPGVGQGSKPDSFTILLVSCVGVTLSVTWWVLIRSYRDLNRAKFQVLLGMEKRLGVPLFGAEWDSLRGDPVKPWRTRYAEFSFVERVIPAVFLIVYVFFGFRGFIR
jgi:hypothetical protein